MSRSSKVIASVNPFFVELTSSAVRPKYMSRTYKNRAMLNDHWSTIVGMYKAVVTKHDTANLVVMNNGKIVYQLPVAMQDDPNDDPSINDNLEQS